MKREETQGKGGTEMWHGKVVAIFIAPAAAAPMKSVLEVKAVPGKGLEGDRYFDSVGTYSHRSGPDREVTLIELEAIEAVRRDYQIPLEPQETRRNIVTEGVPLNHLVGKTFKVGEVVLKGIRLCEPCQHFERLANKSGALKALVHRGGLRAQILTEGLIRVGDPIIPCDEEVTGNEN
jgi:MOSC domain-containing protein YiiM